MNWECWMFPYLLEEPEIQQVIGNSIATGKIKVGSKEFSDVVKLISKHGGGEIRLRPVFSKKDLESFEFFRVFPKKIFTVTDSIFCLNQDYAESLGPYHVDEYGEYIDRRQFISNRPKLKDNQFSALDFSDHLLAPTSFEPEGIELLPLQSKKFETWPSHKVMNTRRMATDFANDESVELVDSDVGYLRPNFHGLITLKRGGVDSLGSLFKLPGSSDIGDSFWGCSKEFHLLYKQSGFTGLNFQPILIEDTLSHREYLSDWTEILNNLNAQGKWRSMY